MEELAAMAPQALLQQVVQAGREDSAQFRDIPPPLLAAAVGRVLTKVLAELAEVELALTLAVIFLRMV